MNSKKKKKKKKKKENERMFAGWTVSPHMISLNYAASEIRGAG